MICIACNTEYSSNFCPNCGENSKIKKITFNSFIQDAFATITNMDKGFLYNLKTLFINPKKIPTGYLLGKRKGILNPISFLIISISIYLILENLFKVPNEHVDTSFTRSPLFEKSREVGAAGGKIISAYFKYFWIFSVMLLANTTKLIFGKYNYLEHVALSSFIIGQATLFAIIGFLIFKFPLIFDPLLYLSILYMIYFIFKQGKDKIDILLLSITSLILFVIQIFLVITIIGLAMIY